MSHVIHATCAAALTALAPVGIVHADTLLAQRLIDESVTDTAGPPYTAFFRLIVGEGDLSLFTLPLDETTSPGTTYTFASDADAPNFPFVVTALTDGVLQFASFGVFQSDGLSAPISIIGSEQDFFNLSETDLAGQTISKIEFEVFDFVVQDIGATTRAPSSAEADPLYQVDFSGAIRVFGPGDDNGAPTVVPTPTAAALGLLALVGLGLRSRSPYPD